MCVSRGGGDAGKGGGWVDGSSEKRLAFETVVFGQSGACAV